MTTIRCILLRATMVSLCAVNAMLATISRAAGDASQNDVQFISCEGNLTDDVGASEQCCPSANEGDCYSGSSNAMTGFMQRLACMQKSMQQQGVTYAVAATQFYQGVTDGGVEQEFDTAAESINLSFWTAASSDSGRA